jgi:hypothetical protein
MKLDSSKRHPAFLLANTRLDEVAKKGIDSFAG